MAVSCRSFHRRLPCIGTLSRFRFSLALLAIAAGAAVCASPLPARAAVAPTALMAGPNFGSADSFQGPHDWSFHANRGTFDVEIHSMGDGHDSVPLNSAFTFKITIRPRITEKSYTYKQNPDGFSFRGTVAGPTNVVVHIIPASSTLVRVARNYTIEASGDAVSFNASGADPIVGTYMDMSQGHGAVRFQKDGTILCADGTQGKWIAFDQSLRIYAVTLGALKASVKLVPGRGLLDQAGNGNSLFDSAH